MKKTTNEEGEEIEPSDYVCRSHDNEWCFFLCDTNCIHTSVNENAIKAVRALNLDFCAVDVIRVPSTNTTSVLEVNKHYIGIF